jgi:starch phosphorylase
MNPRTPLPAAAGSPLLEKGVRVGRSAAALKQSILDHLHFTQGRVRAIATETDWYMALASAVRDRTLEGWIHSLEAYLRKETKIVSYLSAEFLMGPHLGNTILNLGLEHAARTAVAELGLEYDRLLAVEPEPGLGNGGLGRLAACYMDSLATLRVPAIGYGVHYEFGIFEQEIRDGWQTEKTDNWLGMGNPWELRRPEIAYTVGAGGRTEQFADARGAMRMRWIPYRVIKGVAHDTPVSGYRSGTANFLRLWKSEAVESFDFQAFNMGDYYEAVDEKVFSETISKVLYPNDEPEAGKKLRLLQQYFFASCSLQDMIRIHLIRGGSINEFHEGFAVQLNDTHPSIAVAELMRLLVDEHWLEWEKAWEITRAAMGYTNHTLLPEALERWPLPLFASILPRHLEIIFEINRRFLEEVRARFPGDDAKVARLSLIDEGGEKAVRMANLASVGSHAINGVARLHSELVRTTVLSDFHDMFPERFLNVTNGVTPRRWVALSNPALAALITQAIGRKWLLDFAAEMPKLEPFAEDAGFREDWRKVKRENKERLAAVIRDRTGVTVDPSTLFDIQVKRIHEYKRQHLNVFHVIALYQRIKSDPSFAAAPRTVIFGGKAAPGYFMAKRIIKLITSVAEVVNGDPAVRDLLKVVFIPNFSVTVSQVIYPAADLSEQISTAGKEASGTGNMKFAMNGAVTIGTLDGANIEIREEVGEKNFFLFGLKTEEVAEARRTGYDPRELYASDPVARSVIDALLSGEFSRGARDLFAPLVDSLFQGDPYMVLADFSSYRECQTRVSAAFRDRDAWTKMSILNVARTGKFSSDRSISEYCANIWRVKPG